VPQRHQAVRQNPLACQGDFASAFRPEQNLRRDDRDLEYRWYVKGTAQCARIVAGADRVRGNSVDRPIQPGVDESAQVDIEQLTCEERPDGTWWRLPGP
jgi:hypothetical protein